MRTKQVLITPHAADAFRSRVRPRFLQTRVLQTQAVLRLALTRPVFRLDLPGSGLTLWGALLPDGMPFLAATDPADESAPFLLVRTVGPWWFWHEARPSWVEAGIVKRTGGRWRVIPPRLRTVEANTPERKCPCP